MHGCKDDPSRTAKPPGRAGSRGRRIMIPHIRSSAAGRSPTPATTWRESKHDPDRAIGGGERRLGARARASASEPRLRPAPPRGGGRSGPPAPRSAPRTCVGGADSEAGARFAGPPPGAPWVGALLGVVLARPVPGPGPEAGRAVPARLSQASDPLLVNPAIHRLW